ncbi:MAG TPA: flavodoxin-dependent (E)-4-hydroxy-3-methylbut-2-enyl-diphosphate synthase [Candidatus Omnitrophota bacterium]|nr:flavodoxin-dependent (E)-4-hydroxy-3-methylbut-2-enyl-diphosphate synthase [Candidatus Omnitrophota bacterium]HPT06773.1 flavodoxin-dependent (E)-4-hydroxy-3-methylbut-2-enyl-diphosphate synthase [Candidatus Omnitrophota bacterium]
MIKRRKTHVVKIGDVKIGGSNPVAIQSMAKIKTSRVEEVTRQINELADAGCEIIRVAVKDRDDAVAIAAIKRGIGIPLVADIHFDWRLAVAAAEHGADKVRLNPGNITKKDDIERVIAALKQAHIPLRVGANSGSVKAPGTSVAAKLVQSVLDYIRIIEKCKFHDIVISLKASTVLETIDAYRAMSRVCEYPLHLGVTATGLPHAGAIKSGIACGILLSEGIGDTMRISLTDKPVEEIKAARAILEALEVRHFGYEIISCPTCGRCEVNLIKVVNELEEKLSAIDYRPLTRPVKVAVMGCVVNGPGEASEADIGVAFGKKDGLLFKSGKSIRTIGFDECVGVLVKEIKKIHV